MFTRLCGGTLSSKFVNPFDNTHNIFVMFDSVHLFKCIRNNWLNQIDSKQTFHFPDFIDHNKILTASVSDLKMLQNMEQESVVKLAPALNKKVLFPTSLERQNVNLCVRLFDQKNVAALKQYQLELKYSNVEGTICFLEIVLKWWKIFNVTHAYKGVRFNDSNCHPITSVDHESILFLRQFLIWVEKWNNVVVQGEGGNIKKRNGKLTSDTQLALTHTVSTTLEIVKSLFTVLNFKYVLLGKFQTDDLEARFGQYRQMSGACYNISFAQVIESEKKLKTLSIIKVFSAIHREVEIRDIFVNEKDTECETSFESCDISEFEEVCHELESVHISENDLVGITYIGGYICHKLLKYLECEGCKSCFVLLDKTSVLSSNALSYYFNVIDRGNLKYPSDIVINILVTGFKVFKVMIGERYENTFLNCKSQRNVLMSVIYYALDGIDLDVCHSCGRDLNTFFKKCIFTFCNILLNNYSKIKKQKLIDEGKKSTKKRKLDKLSNKD